MLLFGTYTRRALLGNIKPMKLSARVFKRKVVVFVRKMSLVKDPQGLAHRLVTPQLIGGAVMLQQSH